MLRGSCSISFRHRKLQLALFAFLLRVYVAPAAPVDFEKIRDRVRSTTEAVALARIDGTTITNQTLRQWLDTVKPKRFDQLSVEQIMALPAADLAEVISSLGFYEMARREALNASDFASTAMVEALNEKRSQVLQARLIEKLVNQKNPPMTDEQARRFYEQNKHLYTEPFIFSVRTIFLS
ncbi:hypothetical protein FJY63_15325, partial [Candidatus Sumerlaeota bacterium]|nr:hypothetical protein [Candidatus Sumerlaeota bacterium]